jgi:5-methylcytosine-specific restriction protein A
MSRSDAARAYRHLYKTSEWQRLREIVLSQEPLCRYCAKAGRTTAAEVVDHIKPHKGSRALFFALSNLQPLCSDHHNTSKKFEESRGYSNEIGLDGRPVDPRHPGYN